MLTFFRISYATLLGWRKKSLHPIRKREPKSNGGTQKDQHLLLSIHAVIRAAP